MEKLYLEIWQENPKTKKAFRVRQQITAMGDCVRTQASDFLAGYLLEQYRFVDCVINKHNIKEKVFCLDEISEIFNNTKLEIELNGARFFIRFSNFVPA